jgi:hypothetical protein
VPRRHGSDRGGQEGARDRARGGQRGRAGLLPARAPRRRDRPPGLAAGRQGRARVREGGVRALGGRRTRTTSPSSPCARRSAATSARRTRR